MRAIQFAPFTLFNSLRRPSTLAISGIVMLLAIGGCSDFDVSRRVDGPAAGVTSLSGSTNGEPPIRMAELANDVTSLEDEIHRCGSVTVKQPDVWGDADLMGYIQEYEQVMINRLGDFKDTIQGYIARSDQADLQSMTSLGLTLGSSTGTPPTPFSTFTSSNASNTSATPVSLSTTSTPSAPQGQVFDVLNQALSNANASPTAKFSLEPTESLRQNSTYLKVNQGLRRINSGADSAQAAGYGLYLLRVPVSILPGRRTRQGFSAVVTMRAQMVIDPDHLRVTFPKLVFGDLADQLLRTYEDHWREDNLPRDTSSTPSPSKPKTKMHPPRLNAMLRSATLTLASPVTTQQYDELYGYDQMNFLFKAVKANLGQIKSTNGNPPRDELRKWLISYFNRMYDEMKERQVLTGPVYHFVPQAGAAYARGDNAGLAKMRAGWERMAGPGSELASAGWMLIAQAAVLERQLKDSIKDIKQSGHLPLACDDASIDRAEFANTCPPPESQTQELWSSFIQTQYPMHVFELDPNIDEQNIYNAFSQRRELQLAIAFAVANGNLRADQAMKYSRQMALDMATIDLNRTQVGFAHENDTFGWYFYPRVQAIDPEHSTLGSCFKTLFCGGFTRDDELQQRRIEPGIRECEVLVVMPNFVPELKLDITTNWEKLTRPGQSKLDYNEMIDMGAQVECVKHRAMNVCDAHCYRPGDYERLVSRVEQLEKMLPLQTYSVTVPYQYDLPGSQLFDKGAASLNPEITGYYGLSWIKRGSPTVAQFFLTGHHFHPTRTHVIIGGTEVHTSSPLLIVSTSPATSQTVQTTGQNAQTAGQNVQQANQAQQAGQTAQPTGQTTSTTSSSKPADSASPTSAGPTLARSESTSSGGHSESSSGHEGTSSSGGGSHGESGSGSSGSGSGTSSGGSSGGNGASGGGTGSGASGSGGTGTGGTGSGGTAIVGGSTGGGTGGVGGGTVATPTVSTAQTATAASNSSVQWTTQQVEVISRDLLRITVSSISPELSSGPIPVRVATPAGLSNEFDIDPAPPDTPSSPPFSLINPVITFPFSVNATKTGVVVNPLTVASGFELKSTGAAGTADSVQVKLTVPSTNASTTIAYKLSDNTGAAAIDAWLQDQCTAVLDGSLNFTNPTATPSPITVNVTVMTAGSGTTSSSSSVSLPTPLQLQPKLVMAAANPSVPTSATVATPTSQQPVPVPPTPAPAAAATAAKPEPAATEVPSTAAPATETPPVPAPATETPPAPAPAPATEEPSASAPPARVRLKPAPPATEPSSGNP